MPAAVLVQPLVVRPEAVGHVGAAEDGIDAVPVADPDVVRRGGGRGERLQIADGRGRAPVDAGQVAERVQLIDPGADEALDGGAAGRVVLVVALHVEVDRAAGAKAERGGVAGGVVGRGGALARGDRG